MKVQYWGNSLHVVLDKRFRDVTVYQFLVNTLQLPDGFVRRLFAQSGVRVDTTVVFADDLLPASGRLVLMISSQSEKVTSHQSEHPFTGDARSSLDVLYEDDHALVVNKPADLIVHSDKNDELTLDVLVATYYQENAIRSPILHAHRLDRPTTGAVVYAKHPFMARALDAQLASRTMSRRYVAIVAGMGIERQQVVDFAIGRDRHRAGYFRVSSTGKPSRTYVERQAHSHDLEADISLVKLSLETGRTHQIRVHMAALGAPVLGDVAYGGRDKVGNWPVAPQIALHAWQASFFHPYDQKQVTVEAPLDDGWRQFLRKEWGMEDIFSVKE